MSVKSIESSLELRLSGSEERLGAAREEAEEKQEKVRSLVDVLRTTNEKFLAMEARIGSLEAECAGKGRMVRELNARIGELRTGEQERDATIAALEEKIRTEALESEERVRDLQDRLGSLQGSLRSGIEEREEMERAMERKKDEMASVRKELAEVIVRAGEMEENKSREIETHKSESLRLRNQLAEKERLIRTLLTSVMVKMRELPLRLSEMRSDVERFADVAALHSDEALEKMRARLEATVESYGKMVTRYRKEMQMRKRLHNELIELRGNIRVFVRVRPRIETDPAPGSGVAVTYDPDDDSLLHVSNHRGKSVRYEADKVFRPAATQEEVYREVKSLVQSCMDGYNVCIFAYGQTGSGKTYTMEGERNKPGINERALSDLFSIIEQRSCQWQHEVTVSLLEIYNESLRDLLSSSSEKLDIRMNPDGTLKVSQLVARTVKNIREVNELFETGRKNRATACTNMNERSSRSHAVLVVNVSGTSRGGGGDERRVSGRLNLIDLAGSERVSRSGASGDRLREAQNINRSLSALGDVIQALRNKQPHVPFRNSKLTYLLQDSLSNDSKTLMLVQVSPSASSASETICSLAFAQRVRAVELAVPHLKKPPQQQSKQ